MDNSLANPLQTDSLTGLITLILNAVIDIGVIVLVLALVWTGFKFVMAQGQEEQIREARSSLLWTLIGGLLLLGATAISLVLQATVERL